MNTTIFAVEALAGFQSHSLSLIMDSVHNFSDELALVCLYLAFALPVGLSRNFLRSSNVFNSIGIVAVSALLLWQALARFLEPVPVSGMIPIVVGVLAAIGNWGVARLLKGPARDNPAIRLAYIHNLGDVQVSLAPVLSGILVLVSGHSYFDSIIAGLIALWISWATLREVIGSREELVWPEKVSCGHADEA